MARHQRKASIIVSASSNISKYASGINNQAARAASLRASAAAAASAAS